jgi:hypothetical protein
MSNDIKMKLISQQLPGVVVLTLPDLGKQMLGAVECFGLMEGKKRLRTRLAGELPWEIAPRD